MNKSLYPHRAIMLGLLCALFFMPVVTLANQGSLQQHGAHYQDDLPLGDEINDPFESFNRAVYKFNLIADALLLKPITRLYQTTIPPWGRARVTNFLHNLAAPVTIANTAFQGDANQTSVAFWRFILNSTYGLGGIFDFAADRGLRERIEDFGQTAGRYGVKSGPYLMLPLFGPSSVRDGTGTIIDLFLDPFNYLLSDNATITRTLVNTVELRSQNLSLTNEIERTSLDPYATIRSLYLQNREDVVHNGTVLPELEYGE